MPRKVEPGRKRAQTPLPVVQSPTESIRTVRTRNWVSYLRVSTNRQGVSGLGLEAQRTAVAYFLKGVGGNVIAELVEIESGSHQERPQLNTALVVCRKQKARLVVAKLDRLSRNVAFISKLMESGVDFVAADMPSANRLTLHVMAAFAEYEREAISARTKAALAAAKARGVKLGGPKLNQARRIAYLSTRLKTARTDSRVLPIIRQLQADGAKSVVEIVRRLRVLGVPARHGGTWGVFGVTGVLRRASCAGYESLVS